MTPTEETRKPYPRGTYSKVARRLSVTPQHVRLVALGVVKSARVTRELAKEQRKAEAAARSDDAAA
jgi:hypothetical protein